MATREHHYQVNVRWTGNRGAGTQSYTAYDRNGELSGEGKATVALSADPAFRGDAARWNPEELLLASVSACHKLWYLHLCADAGIAVLEYRDHAEGTMLDNPQQGRFSRIVLRPHVVIQPGGDAELAQRLHHVAHEKCYIANSVNFPILCEPVVETGAG